MAHSIADFIRPMERGLRGSAMWLPAGETVLPAGVAVNAYRNDTYFFFEISKPVHVRNSPSSTPVYIEPGTLFCPKFDVTQYGYRKFLLSECRLLTADEYKQYRRLPLV